VGGAPPSGGGLRVEPKHGRWLFQRGGSRADTGGRRHHGPVAGTRRLDYDKRRRETFAGASAHRGGARGCRRLKWRCD